MKCVTIGIANTISHATLGAPSHSVAVFDLKTGQPTVMVGMGGGVVRSAIQVLGGFDRFPTTVLLLSVSVTTFVDLPVFLRIQALQKRSVSVLAPSDVLDRVVQFMEDILCEEDIHVAMAVQQYTKFVELELDAPTGFTTTGGEGESEGGMTRHSEGGGGRGGGGAASVNVRRLGNLGNKNEVTVNQWFVLTQRTGSSIRQGLAKYNAVVAHRRAAFQKHGFFSADELLSTTIANQTGGLVDVRADNDTTVIEDNTTMVGFVDHLPQHSDQLQLLASCDALFSALCSEDSIRREVSHLRRVPGAFGSLDVPIHPHHQPQGQPSSSQSDLPIIFYRYPSQEPPLTFAKSTFVAKIGSTYQVVHGHHADGISTNYSSAGGVTELTTSLDSSLRHVKRNAKDHHSNRGSSSTEPINTTKRISAPSAVSHHQGEQLASMLMTDQSAAVDGKGAVISSSTVEEVVCEPLGAKQVDDEETSSSATAPPAAPSAPTDSDAVVTSQEQPAREETTTPRRPPVQWHAMRDVTAAEVVSHQHDRDARERMRRLEAAELERRTKREKEAEPYDPEQCPFASKLRAEHYDSDMSHLVEMRRLMLLRKPHSLTKADNTPFLRRKDQIAPRGIESPHDAMLDFQKSLREGGGKGGVNPYALQRGLGAPSSPSRVANKPMGFSPFRSIDSPHRQRGSGSSNAMLPPQDDTSPRRPNYLHAHSAEHRRRPSLTTSQRPFSSEGGHWDSPGHMPSSSTPPERFEVHCYHGDDRHCPPQTIVVALSVRDPTFFYMLQVPNVQLSTGDNNSQSTSSIISVIQMLLVSLHAELAALQLDVNSEFLEELLCAQWIDAKLFATANTLQWLSAEEATSLTKGPIQQDFTNALMSWYRALTLLRSARDDVGDEDPSSDASVKNARHALRQTISKRRREREMARKGAVLWFTPEGEEIETMDDFVERAGGTSKILNVVVKLPPTALLAS